MFHKQYDFILNDIENQCEINKYSMSSIFDYSEPIYKESKDYVDNHLELINQLKKDKILHYVGNEYKDMFYIFRLE